MRECVREREGGRQKRERGSEGGRGGGERESDRDLGAKLTFQIILTSNESYFQFVTNYLHKIQFFHL